MNKDFKNKSHVRLLVNGELYLLNYEVFLNNYLKYLNLEESFLSSNIFECNNKIIFKKELIDFKLRDFTKLELVQVVGGG
jgi:sulfur carrier protein ThiS